MLIGYARTSTLDQVAGFDAQIAEFTALRCDRIYKEQASSVGERKELEEALDYTREGDTFVVTKLDRLARNTQHLLEITQRLEGKGVSLRVLNLGLDTSTPTGKLMLTMLGAINQFEREMMLERQREGIAKAKAEGKYKGRKPTAKARKDEVLGLINQGMTKEAIATQLGIGIASVYRIQKEARGALGRICGDSCSDHI
ncbi:recombinase family protein [Oxalobacter vibrioformis]|uniref:Recombinase family protein n=1 Tax=Oxalobacter vibrioformis TaxID=933080 RepID=A0A9E9LX86_9BURK|nr:recombinase family protein [Oxalobacter vibrioformis]WAW10382.1 recombinase family protein [Oxalobacter vibrioformis]